jgi:ATP-dependent Lon protease
VLALRDTVVFPHMAIPLFVGRDKSVSAVRNAWESKDKKILLLAQKTQTDDIPNENDEVYDFGTICVLNQVLNLPDGTIKILVSGKVRGKIEAIALGKEYISAAVIEQKDVVTKKEEVRAVRDAVFRELIKYLKGSSKLPIDLLTALEQIPDHGMFIDTVVSVFPMSVDEKQKYIEIADVLERLKALFALLEKENNVYNVERCIRGRVRKQIEKTQREYYLTEQLRAIHKELGNVDEDGDELLVFEERIRKTKLSKEARELALANLKRLKAMNAMSSEANVVRGHLEWLLDLPWQKESPIKKDLAESEKILERDHYGLKAVKERILEQLAILLRVKKFPGQILCFVGPPGVGKSSLGKSIAEATGRSFVKISLGGVSDEAEIRGHRSTYIGALPGKILQGMKKAKTSNPLFLLDEIDKLAHDWRGDPMSALLEILDPAQNSTFSDHYIEVDYDLSNVLFIATANSLNMPQPLLDRLEVIRLPGYTEDEKLQIAKRHLCPRQTKLHGLKNSEFAIPDEIIMRIIREYTKEAGVRNLEREIATLARKSVKEITSKNIMSVTINDELLVKFCGVPKYSFGKSVSFSSPGASTGLAWTETGGDIMFVEVLIFVGKGKIIQTGNLGDVMKESIRASVSYIRSRSLDFGIATDFFEKHDIHVHVPEGATPKDGPSAGTAICCALVSALTGVVVLGDVAMTGEMNLRGQVLAIGGLKEKLLAAHRSGIKTVIIPKDNEKDLTEIDEKVKRDISFVFASTVDDVLKVALASPEKIKLSNTSRIESKK